MIFWNAIKRLWAGVEVGDVSVSQSTIMKGMAIFLIAFHNYFHWVVPSIGENEFSFDAARVVAFSDAFSLSFLASFHALFSFFGHFGVQVFIVLSGYGVAKSYAKKSDNGFAAFFFDRLRKLYPAFLVAVAVFVVLGFFVSSQVPGVNYWQSVIRKLLFFSNFTPNEALSLNGPWWFYSFIVQLYLVFPLLYFVVKKFKVPGFVFLTVLSLSLVYFLNPFFEKYNLNLLQNFPGHIAEFSLGILIALSPRIRMPLVVVLLALVSFYFSHFNSLVWLSGFLSVSILFLVAVRLLGRVRFLVRWLAPFFSYLGALSMYLFAIHGILRAPFVAVANRMNSPESTIILGLFFFLVSVIAANGVKQASVFLEKSDWSSFKLYRLFINGLASLFKTEIIQNWTKSWLVFVVITVLLRIASGVFLCTNNGYSDGFIGLLTEGLLNDFVFLFILFIPGLLIFRLIAFAGNRIAEWTARILTIILSLIQMGLVLYYVESGMLLDEVVYSYSFSELWSIVVNSLSVGLTQMVFFVLLVVGLAFVFVVMRRVLLHRLWVGMVITLSFVFLFGGFKAIPDPSKYVQISDFYTVNNSLNYFFFRISKYSPASDLQVDNKELMQVASVYQNDRPTMKFQDTSFPFWHLVLNNDVLGPYFRVADKEALPNIVVIVVESLGRDVSGPGAIKGSFTPFLDSLAAKGLYFANFLSTSERTFEVLPSILGSLPYGRDGFAEYAGLYPDHLSLPKILKESGYTSTFFYGGDPDFNNMKAFLEANEVVVPFANTNFSRVPGVENPGTWGWNDAELYSQSLDYINKNGGKAPRLDIFLTLTTHAPFDYPDKPFWESKASSLIQNNNTLNPAFRTELSKKTDVLGSFLYADNQLRRFFERLKSDNSFSNTVFIITGDHRAPEIVAASQIANYHVPLIVYSPMMKSGGVIKSVSSHLDVAPTILSWLSGSYDVKVPSYAHWMGKGIDMEANFRSDVSLGFMLINRNIEQYLHRDTLISHGGLYRIDSMLQTIPVDTLGSFSRMSKRLFAFDALGSYACDLNRIKKGSPNRAKKGIVAIKSVDEDFEADVPSYYKGQLSSEMAFSGKECLVLEPTTEYGGVLQQTDLPSGISSISVGLSSKVFLSNINDNKPPSLVLHVIAADGTSLVYKSLPIADITGAPLEKNVWSDFSFYYRFNLADLDSHGGGVLKVYFYNKDKAKIFYDDLMVDVAGE